VAVGLFGQVEAAKARKIKEVIHFFILYEEQ
jgi:hypothetical protein